MLYYYYYPKAPDLMSANRNGFKYRLVTCVWRSLPLPVARKLSPLAFKQLD